MAMKSATRTSNGTEHSEYDAERESALDEMRAIIRQSWRLIKEKGEKSEDNSAKTRAEAVGLTPTPAKAAAKKKAGSGGYGGGIMDRLRGKNAGGYVASTSPSGAAESAENVESSKRDSVTTYDVPETFDEMMRLNAKMTGANLTWIEIVLGRFDDIVLWFCSGRMLEEETHVFALRIHTEMQGNCNLQEFRVCMLASLRSLLPGRWNNAHEKAWLQLWGDLEAGLQAVLDYPGKYKTAVLNMYLTMDDQLKRKIGFGVWEQLFMSHPAAESIFKQSNEKLCQIALAGLEFSARIYEQPKQVVAEVSSLGLRHIMFQVDPQFFIPYVELFVKEVAKYVDDQTALDGFSWALSIIAAIMARTIQEGNTPILQAGVTNNVKDLKKALRAQPRGSRNNNILSTTTI